RTTASTNQSSLRGWHTGSETDHYNSAVRAGMRHWALFGDEGVIAEADIDQYLVDNPYNAAGSFDERLEQISVQKWTSLFLDFYEIFANWRRTGYPALVPTNYPGNITGGRIPRRNIVPDSEENLNEDNFNEALQRQGVGNDLMSTVWWDPENPNN
ncbi:MAG: SusD/RagB family nutrient-binding outer membrane lipoprotein, partial [Bacteroidota bacterium]